MAAAQLQAARQELNAAQQSAQNAQAATLSAQARVEAARAGLQESRAGQQQVNVSAAQAQSASASVVQARANDTTMRDAALSGGAQFVSTDYEVPDARLGPYVVKIPDGTPARCNPVTAPPKCTSADIEHPAALTESAP